MTKLNGWKMACAVVVLCAATAVVAAEQTFSTLTDFSAPNGIGPELVSLVQGTDGTFYGTTALGGLYGGGTVFKMTSVGVVTTLYSFCQQGNPCYDGYRPSGGLVLATDGNFYGTTQSGGANGYYGTVFKVTPAGKLTTLHSFNGADGGFPSATLVQGTDGNLYGTTIEEVSNNYGTIFRVSPSGTFKIIYSFCTNCASGNSPSGLVQGVDGNFYGVTGSGGVNLAGTVFKMTPAGKLTTLYSFCAQQNCTDGDGPVAALIQGSDGNFYGTTGTGGACDYPGCFEFFFPGGTVFKITPQGALTTLYSFCSQQQPCTDGLAPSAPLVQGTEGSFYGTTLYGGNFACNDTYFEYGCGTVFKITAQGTLTTMHTFDFTGGDGAYPNGALVQATNGTLYATTTGGGIECGTVGCGTAFRLNLGLGPFVKLGRYSGKVGQTGVILGQGFIGTTDVSLNGTPASFTVVSDTFLRAKVPAGATSGFVTVTTPSGTLKSDKPFQVVP